MLLQNTNKIGEDAAIEIVDGRPIICAPQEFIRVPDDHVIKSACMKERKKNKAKKYEVIKEGNNQFKRGKLIK